MRLWRRLLIWILVLHTVHAPVPVPDLDGECRGTPIPSLADCRAWHPVLLGVRPNDDVDRGPVRSSHDQGPWYDGSQFGDLAICLGRFAQVAAPMLIALPGSSPMLHPVGRHGPIIQSDPCVHRRPAASPRTILIEYCVWLI